MLAHHDIDAALGAGAGRRMLATMEYLAWRKWRIPREQVEDLLQAAFLTYLEVRGRYPKAEEHVPILVGIFRNKCREHLAATGRSKRAFEALRGKPDVVADGESTIRPEATLGSGVLGEIVKQEEGRRILAALAKLRPEARELFHLITEEGVTRKELLQRLGLNANTLDSRLHTYRRELRGLLERDDVGT